MTQQINDTTNTSFPTEPYPDPDRAGVVRVPIVSNKHKGTEAIIDAADLPVVGGRHVNLSPGKAGNQIAGGSLVINVDGVPRPLARMILRIDDADQLVCHVNGDRLDCRRENLIVRTRSEVAKARKPSPETLARLAPYPDPDRPGVWRVPLKSHVAHREALIDEVDLPVVRGRNWNWSTRSEEGRTEGVRPSL